jgi:hypothetical protein
MTTERRPPESRVKASPLELRLYVVAVLAAIYTISWRAIGAQVTEAPPITDRTAGASEPQRFVWIDHLPPTSVPALSIPVGWQRASPPSATAQPTRLVQTPNRRVRTRSS